MTVLEVIQRSSEFLAKKGVDSPRLQIELLLAHVLKLPRLRLYLNFERPLAEPELAVLRELVKRRANREPLQHILGHTSFCGLEFEVSRLALIPRPETELLAEHAAKFLATLPAATVLDFGTGTGCLAVTLAVQCPSATMHALDVSDDALVLARRNAARHQVQQRITFHHGDGFAPLPDGARFDLIVSNPPYIATAEIETLQPEVRDFDPRPALDGGEDGLVFYRRLAAEAARFLTPDARIMLEFGDGQDGAITKILSAENWIVEAVLADYSGRNRILIARRS